MALGFSDVGTKKGCLRSSVFAIVKDTFGPFIYPDLNKAAAGWFLSGIAILALA
jgi:hypothetical protein